MNDILVLNLTRFGDLIQTTPLLRRLRTAYPGTRITLAAQKQFSAILPLMRGFDSSIIFDQDAIVRSMNGEDAPIISYRNMEDFVCKLEENSYDMVINLTANRMSAYLVSLIKAGRIEGINAAPDGQRLISGLWGTYLYSFLLGDSRRYNRINLVDIFSKMGGSQPDGKPVELFETLMGQKFAEEFITREGLQGKRLIGLQLGASDADRCWPITQFARLSDRLQEINGVRTILFGSKGERIIADQARSLMRHEPVDAVGRTGIEELFSLLRRCRLLVSNDTGTIHFAAAGGVPTVMLTVGPASFFCTGPYSSGNIALQPAIPCSPCRYILDCKDPVCRESLTVEAVTSACRHLLGESIDFRNDFSGIRVYRSLFGPDGFLEWEALHNADAGLDGLADRYLKLWKYFLDGTAGQHAAAGTPLFQELEALTARGEMLSSKLMAAAGKSTLPMDMIGSLGNDESLVEAQIKLLGNCNPGMAPLVDFLTLLRENISGNDLHGVARDTGSLYRQGNRLVNLL